MCFGRRYLAYLLCKSRLLSRRLLLGDRTKLHCVNRILSAFLAIVSRGSTASRIIVYAELVIFLLDEL